MRIREEYLKYSKNLDTYQINFNLNCKTDWIYSSKEENQGL